jgi:hypothetical protein
MMIFVKLRNPLNYNAFIYFIWWRRYHLKKRAILLANEEKFLTLIIYELLFVSFKKLRSFQWQSQKKRILVFCII